MADFNYDNRELIPIGQLRLLNKKFGWQKSLTEVYEQNLVDFHQFEIKYIALRKKIIDKEKNFVGGIEEVSESIQIYWVIFINFIYRVTLRINLVKMSTTRRNVPKSEVKDFVEIFQPRLESAVEIMLEYCKVHFMWYDTYLNDEDTSLLQREGNIWKVYSRFIDAAVADARTREIPVDSYFKQYEIGVKVRESLRMYLREE